MQLPNVFARFRRTPPEEIPYRLALVMLPHHVLAAVWGISANGKPFVAGSGKEAVKDLDSLPEATGAAIDAAVEEAGQDVEEALFGIMDVWLHEGEIDPAYADRLRALSEQLEIRPVAFVSVTQAIVHALKMHESAPPTVILAGIDEAEVSTSVVQTGQVLGSAGEKVHEHTGLAIENAIRLLGVKDHLPPRMLIYGSSDVKDIREDLLAYPWLQRLPFLHFPKINILHDQAVMDAVVEAGVTEYTKGPPATQERPRGSTQTVTGGEARPFGFVLGRDVTKQETVAAEEEQTEHVEDLRAREPEPKTAVPRSHRPPPQYALSHDGAPRPSFSLPSFALPTISLPTVSRLVLLSVGIAFLVIGLLLSAVFTLWVLPRATVTLTVETVRLERDVRIVVDPTVDIGDLASGEIAGKRLTLTQTQSKAATATGEKVVGDPARGKITLYNKSAIERNLPASTELTAQGSGITFVLKDDVRIASSSSTTGEDEVEVITPGTAEATIEALEIGEEGNVAEGTEFAVAGFALDVLKGKVLVALTGGSARTASVVTREDQAGLEEDLLATLRTTALEELSGRLSPDERLLEQSTQQEVVAASFDPEIGEEAEELRATIEATTVATVYDKRDLDTILARSVQDAVPAGYELVPEETQTNVDVSSVDEEGRVTFTAFFQAHLLPTVDQAAVAQAVSGKRIATATEYLRSLPDVIDVNIDVWPKFPTLFATMPRRTEQIEIGRKR